MNPRERLLKTLEHEEPDRVPLTAQLWLDTRLRLRAHYGVETDDGLMGKLGVEPDRTYIGPGPPEGWSPEADFKRFCEATGYEAGSQFASYEEWGIGRKLGSRGSGRELQQFFFTHHPWEHFTEASQVEDAELPDLDAAGRFDNAKEVMEHLGDDRLILGDLGHCQWTRAWELRGMTTFMKDLHTNRKMAEAILDRLNEHFVDLSDRLLDLGAEGLRLAEDWGNNKSMFINPAMWREVFKPRYKRLFDKAKRRGGFVLFHSDGNITPIVGDLVEMGADILNPVQPECMDQMEVKRLYGDRITIDTGISVQRTLPFGTVEDVRREALHALGHLAPGGGFVYGTSHYAMYDVPTNNIIALYDTCRRYGRYPIKIPD